MTYPETKLFINGSWVHAQSGKTIEVLNPASGQPIGRVSRASLADLDQALAGARSGFKIWRDVPAVGRRAIMKRAAQLLRERAESVSTLMTQEQGKPLAEALAETISAADTIDWFADEAMRVYGRVVPSRGPSVSSSVHREPIGPVAAFTPWNFPINQAVRKISAALSAGCSIVLKAPEETPASPAQLVKAFADAGLPPGVLNLVFGDPDEISRYLIVHPIIQKVSFTGSTAVGRLLASLAGQHMKRVTMELGGHAPVIVAEDADVELAVNTMAAAKFRNAGQVCTSPTRFLIHDSVYDRFASAFTERAQNLVVGNGLQQGTQMGPLANGRRTKAVAEMVTDALSEGAQLLAGGVGLGGSGYFWAPTVLSNVPLNAKIFNEEPFGPIAAMQRFFDIDKCIQEANRLPYGLSAYAFTTSAKTIHKLSRGIEAGMLWINQGATPWPELPFGGVKDSGYGSEGGPEALDGYLTTKSITVTNA